MLSPPAFPAAYPFQQSNEGTYWIITVQKKRKTKHWEHLGSREAAAGASHWVFFSCFLPSGHTVVIDRLTRAEWFLFPPEEQNTACVLSYAEGKTREKKIRDRKKTASTSTGCLSLKLSPKHCCRNKRKFHTLGIIPKKLQICYESYELNNEVEAHNSYFFYSNIS